MLKNYLTIGIRNLLRNKFYSLLNILGLAIGMASVILITLFVQHELGFDRFHKLNNRIFKVLRETQMQGTEPSISQGTSGALGPALANDFPEIEKTVRMRWLNRTKVTYNNKSFNYTLCLADADILNVFSFPLIKGDAKTALNAPSAIVITQRAAQNLFGNENPIGKTVSFPNKRANGDYIVTGVLQDIPPKSTLNFDFLSGNLAKDLVQRNLEFWHKEVAFLPIQTFALLSQKASAKEIEHKFPNFITKYLGKEVSAQNTYYLQPLTRMHLYGKQDYSIISRGNITHVYISVLVGILILIVACVNFTNLTTAQSLKRAQEIGLRKVIGAHRKQLTGQFLGESILTALLSLPLAIAFAKIVLPEFNNMVGRWLFLNLNETLPALILFALIVGLIAGLYPALYLSAFGPAAILRGISSQRSGNSGIRGGLVIFQFAISVVLIIGALVVYRQLDYMRTTNLGFEKDHIVVLRLPRGYQHGTTQHQTLRNAYLKHPNILKAAASHTLPGKWGGEQWTFRPEGETNRRMHMLAIDEHFLDTYDIPLLTGRNFSKDHPTDENAAFILNATAAKQLGWTNPIGKQFDWPSINRKGTVIGVVQDFHLRSLHEKIGPTVLCMWTPKSNKLSLKIRAGTISETMTFVKTSWKRIIPNHAISFFFLDASLDQSYRAESKLGTMITRFCTIAVFLACLGLFGLVSLSSQQRIKEIGIRKTLGASVADIVFLLLKNFTMLIAIANLIAWPIAYFTMDLWLQNFAYQTDLNIEIFLLGGLLVLSIALITVAYQALKAASVNPIDALRHK